MDREHTPTLVRGFVEITARNPVGQYGILRFHNIPHCRLAVPLHQQRLKSLRDIKGLKQSELKGLTQFQVSECERKGTDSILLLEKFALALDCTPDFLLGRGFETFDFKNPDDVKVVASRLAFDAFAERLNTPHHQRDRCRRVVGHPSAPLTADGWTILAEQIDLAFGSTNGGTTLRSIEGGKTG